MTYSELVDTPAASLAEHYEISLPQLRTDVEDEVTDDMEAEQERRRAAHAAPVTPIKALANAVDTGPNGRPIPKYRNPVTGDTWSGRGLKPRWVADALASGKTLQSFLIPNADSAAP
jgi:DNA-binding protein H-NS